MSRSSISKLGGTVGAKSLVTLASLRGGGGGGAGRGSLAVTLLVQEIPVAFGFLEIAWT